jgi:hypothetical protein
MKPDTRTSDPKDLGQRAAAAPVPATHGPVTDLEAELLALTQEEESLKERKAQKRHQFWDLTVANLTGTIDKLVGNGFDRLAIAKALGLATNWKTSTAPKKGTGPTTHDGWRAVYFNVGIRSYLKAHPALASALKADKVPSTAYRSHIPPDDLVAIETIARAKAQAKCPAPTAHEVPTK